VAWGFVSYTRLTLLNLPRSNARIFMVLLTPLRLADENPHSSTPHVQLPFAKLTRQAHGLHRLARQALIDD
jgi:hypothetical protein